MESRAAPGIDPAINDGGRAGPGTVPRGSFPSSAAGAFTSLGRLILDRLDRGVVLLDRHRRVQDANALARRVLAARNGVTIRRGRFVFLDPAVDDRLSQLVQALAVSPSGGARAMAAQIRHNRSPPYRVLVSPVPADADEHRVLLFVLIYGPREWRDISIDVLVEVYGLTRAQAEVARSLFTGQSVEQVANSLDLSRNTVRTHLKQIFSRCEVRSQRELLHLLATGPQDL
jgi:DNA-binding CsgD family transcriptional regulator